MYCSFIITFYQNKTLLYHCLNHLFNNTAIDADTMEIIIINDNPAIHLERDNIPNSCTCNIKLINSKVNKGYAGACNEAAKVAQGENLVLIDSDIMVQSGWFEHLVTSYTGMDNIAAASSTILNMSDNTILHFGIANYQIDTVKPFHLAPYKEIRNPFFDNDYICRTITSGCCVISHDLYDKIGGMDPQLYNGYCDLDLFYKLSQKGYRNCVSRHSLVYHRGNVSGTVRTIMTRDTKALFCKSWGSEEDQDGKMILQQIYAGMTNDLAQTAYLVFDFSRSLFSSDYISMLQQNAKCHILDCYNYKNYTQSGKICLDDIMSASMQASRHVFLYFCDNITDLKENHYWFSIRSKSEKDVVIDRSGNLFLCKDLI